MKIKSGYILKTVAGCSIVVSSDVETMDFTNMLNLNDTGAFLWENLEKETTEDELTAKLLAEYDVDEAVARKDVATFLESLREAGLLDE